MEKAIRKPERKMEKLFEIYTRPSEECEDSLEFKIVPSDLLEANMNEDWIDRLGSEVADLFIECISKAAEGGRAAEKDMGIIKMNIRATSEGSIFIENAAQDILQSAINEMDEKKEAVFRRISSLLSQSVIDLIYEYLELVSILIKER